MKAQLFCGPLPHLTGIRELLWRPEGEDETLALGMGSYPEERTRNRVTKPQRSRGTGGLWAVQEKTVKRAGKGSMMPIWA